MLSHYDHDATVSKLLQMTRVHLVPTLNPDGTAEVPKAEEMGEKCQNVDTKNGDGIDIDTSFTAEGLFIYSRAKLPHHEINGYM